MPGCSIRALWILNNQDIVFSRRFPVVERRWRAACKSENENSWEENPKHAVLPLLPTDSELAAAFLERKKREGSTRGFGIRVKQSAEGSDSWVDDPITRHIIGLYINREEERDNYLFWPLILHLKGQFCILISPLVEPWHFRAYAKTCQRSDCGNAVGADGSLSSLLLDLPSITGPSYQMEVVAPVTNAWSFMVAHAIGDIVSGDMIEPEIVVNASPTVGGLLDSLTARAKAHAPILASTTSSTAAVGGTIADTQKTGLRPLDKDVLRTFISSSMPFGWYSFSTVPNLAIFYTGTPIDLSYSNISAIKLNGFSSSDMPPSDLKQPAWKPYLYKGKQRILFTIYETVDAAMYDRDDIPDSITVSGQVNCRAELEGLPDVSFPLTGLSTARVEVISFHPCVQVPEQGVDRQAVMFSPPLNNFTLLRYQAHCGLGPPIKGFYQLSMISEDEGAFLFRLGIMEGYKSPLTMEFCTVTMPFPMRRVVSFDGNPSIGTALTTEHSVEWRIMASGKGVSGKSVEATFSGTIRFSSWKTQKVPSYRSMGCMDGEDSDDETEGINANNMVHVEEFLMEKMSKDLPPVDLEEPFCWQAYNYAKVSFKISGASLSGMTIDPKSVSIYPAVKAPVEFSTQVTSGDYILWNTLGKCPFAATAKA